MKIKETRTHATQFVTVPSPGSYKQPNNLLTFSKTKNPVNVEVYPNYLNYYVYEHNIKQ
jgi:hypothetical protein